MNGSCHCGAIQFTISGQPSWLGRCHCRDCQKISGSAYMAYAEFKIDEVIFTNSAPKAYASSTGATRTFCPDCGSPIEWRRNDLPDTTSITLGLLDTETHFGTLDDLYEEERPSWDV